MSKKDKAMKLALEALDNIYSPLHVREINKVGAAMAALREALAEQFCVACEGNPQHPNSPCAVCGRNAQQGSAAWTLLLTGENQGLVGKAGEKFVGHPEHYERVDVYTFPPVQQESVGYVAENGVVDWNVCAPPILTELYTSPPASKPWVWLTKAEVDAWELPDHPTVFEFSQFVEAKLKEKNT